MLCLISIIDCDLAVGVAGAQNGLALVQLHEETIPESEVRVVEVALLHVVSVYEFAEFLSTWSFIIGIKGNSFEVEGIGEKL